MPKISRPVRPLADVNVLDPAKDGSREVVVCFMPDPDIIAGEGQSAAVLALDASISLKKMYGFGGPFGGDPNYVQAVSRKIGAILCSVAKSGKVPAIYWAVSPDGSKVEDIGEHDETGWGSAVVAGPKKEKWGKGTRIVPAVQHIVDKVARNADWTIGVIITDGIIEDEPDAMKFCLQVGKDIVKGNLKPLKLVLIGIGEEVDEEQLERFDDMFEGSGVDYDLWSHGMVASMQDEADILSVLYGELMDEDSIIAATGHVEDASGKTLVNFKDGLPGKFRFTLPKGQKSFTIHTPNQAITQDVSEAVS